MYSILLHSRLAYMQFFSCLCQVLMPGNRENVTKRTGIHDDSSKIIRLFIVTIPIFAAVCDRVRNIFIIILTENNTNEKNEFQL